MNLLKKLFGGSSAQSGQRYYIFSVKCNRCGEVIKGRVDLSNDLSVEYEKGGDIFYARKILIGENRCFQRIEVELKFNTDRKLLEQHVTGGQFVS
ncbi:hypothetical protein ANAEL_00942 [Anaerolineales bacterium]|nr:hypothetical protein ANAEL_00942 [Anaerolineales bacterium]